MKGIILKSQIMLKRPCETCEGRGNVPEHKQGYPYKMVACPDCGGSGVWKDPVTIRDIFQALKEYLRY